MGIPEDMDVLLPDTSAVDQIEVAHKHECIEDKCIVLPPGYPFRLVHANVGRIQWVVALVVEHEWASEDQDQHHGDLVGRLAEDVSPHDWVDQRVLSTDSLSCAWVALVGRLVLLILAVLALLFLLRVVLFVTGLAQASLTFHIWFSAESN